jgi:negative regulator of flagellin synthesis FlgM
MRIEALNQVQQVFGTGKVKHSGQAAEVSRKDNVHISSIGKDIQVAKQAVKDAPDIREELVAPLRERVQNGTYDVSAEDFADKLLAEFA